MKDRRLPQHPQSNSRTVDQRLLRVGDVELDLNALTVRVDNRRTVLTYREFLVLRFLMTHAGRVVDRRSIAHAAWRPQQADSAPVNIYISRLRRRLGDHPEHRHRHIRTVRHSGYVFDRTSLTTPTDPHTHGVPRES